MSTVFTTVIAGAWLAVTVAVDGGEVIGVVEPDGVPDAVAVFVTVPASMSACVTAYVAVQLSEAPAANVVDGQSIADKVPVPENVESSTATSDRSTFPVFVTSNEYVTC